MLIFQAGLCYIPKFVWDNFEGGLMHTIGEGLNPGLHKEEEVSSRKKVIIDYIVKHIRVSDGGLVWGSMYCEASEEDQKQGFTVDLWNWYVYF